jgi:hypothetical protein
MRVLFTIALVPAIIGPTLAQAQACNDLKLAFCYGNAVAAPAMLATVPMAKLIKDRGGFRDLGACEEWGRTPYMMVDGGVESSVAGIVAGTCGECACRLAF